jgi:hypothetical protein
MHGAFPFFVTVHPKDEKQITAEAFDNSKNPVA